MSIKKNTKSFLKYVSTALLTLGVVTSAGLLSFCGALVFSPSLVLASLAFFLSAVEGEVYRQNIFKAFSELQFLGPKGLQKLLLKELDEYIKNEKDTNSSTFLCDYTAQKNDYLFLKNVDLTDEELTKDDVRKIKEKTKKAKKRLEWMKLQFVKNVLKTENEEYYSPALIKKIKEKLPTAKRKLWLIRLSVPLTLAAGIGAAFATASTMQTALLAFGLKFGLALSATALSGLVWPLAVIGGIGYVFLIYHTIADIIKNDTIIKWRNKLVDWFSRKSTDTTAKYIFRASVTAILALSILTLGTIATLATAGTWWTAVKYGAMLAPAFAHASTVLRNVLVPLITGTQFLFAIKNSLDTVKMLLKNAHLPRPIEYIKHKIAKLRKNENGWQNWNPFRILVQAISIPYKSFVFFGHVIAEALVADDIGVLNRNSTTAISAVSNTAQDAHCFFEAKKKKPDPSSPPKKQHEHGNIPEWILKAVLSPLIFTSALWHWGFQDEKDKTKPYFSFKKVLMKSFGVKPLPFHYKDRPHTQISSTWTKKEIDLRFKKQEERLEHVFVKRKLAGDKKIVLEKFKSNLKKNIDHPNTPSPFVFSTQQKKMLNENRLFGFHKKTKTAHFIEKMAEEYRPCAARTA